MLTGSCLKSWRDLYAPIRVWSFPLCVSPQSISSNKSIDLRLTLHLSPTWPENGYSEIVRREPLLWVTSANHAVHEETVLPLAFGRPTCIWRHQGD